MKKLCMQYKVKILILFVIIILSSGANIYAGLKLSTYYDIITSTNLKKAILAAIYLILLWILSVFLAYIASYYKSTLLKLFNNKVRDNMLIKISRLDYEEYAKKEPGEFTSWLVNDVNQLEKNMFIPFFEILQSAFIAIFALVALCSIHPLILLASIFSAVVLSIVPKMFEKSMENTSIRVSKWNEVFSQKVYNMIAGFEVFIIGNNRRLLLEKTKEIYEKSETEKMYYNRKLALIEMLNTMIFRIFEMSIIILTAVLAFQGAVSAGMIFAVGNLSNRFLNGVNSLLAQWVLMKSSKNLFFKFDAEEKEEKENCPQIREGIFMEDVALCFGEKRIIEHLDLEFLIGEKYAIVGESGAGKSTLIKSVIGFHDDYSGHIHFDHADKKNFSKDSVFEQVAYISQNVYLFNDTIGFNLTLGREYPEEKIMEVLRWVNLDSFISQQPNGMNTMLGDHGKNISGGQKQRLVIAREFLQGKRIFFVDEGTSALDKKNQEMIQDLLLSNADFTVIMISHHLSTQDVSQFTKVYHLGENAGMLC